MQAEISKAALKEFENFQWEIGSFKYELGSPKKIIQSKENKKKKLACKASVLKTFENIKMTFKNNTLATMGYKETWNGRIYTIRQN